MASVVYNCNNVLCIVFACLCLFISLRLFSSAHMHTDTHSLTIRHTAHTRSIVNFGFNHIKLGFQFKSLADNLLSNTIVKIIHYKCVCVCVCASEKKHYLIPSSNLMIDFIFIFIQFEFQQHSIYFYFWLNNLLISREMHLI